MKGKSAFFIEDAELASDTGRELQLPALTHQMFPTSLKALPAMFMLTYHGLFTSKVWTDDSKLLQESN